MMTSQKCSAPATGTVYEETVMITCLMESWKAKALEPTRAPRREATTVPIAFEMSSSTV